MRSFIEIISCGLIILSFIEYSIGVVAAINVSKYSKFNNNCHNVWEWSLTASIIDIVTPVIAGYFICSMIKYQNQNNRKSIVSCDKFIITLSGNIFIGIWSVIIMDNIGGTECMEFWKTNAPPIINYLRVHLLIFGIVIALIIVHTIFKCIAYFNINNNENQSLMNG
jgi:hypothetical protein